MTDQAVNAVPTAPTVDTNRVPNPWQGAAAGFGFLLLIGGVIALVTPAGVDSQGAVDLAGLFAKDFIATAIVMLGTMLVGVWVLIGAMEWRARRPAGR